MTVLDKRLEGRTGMCCLPPDPPQHQKGIPRQWHCVHAKHWQWTPGHGWYAELEQWDEERK